VLLVIDHDRPAEGDKKLDLVGVGVLSASLFALLLSLDLGTDHGWGHPLIIGLFAVAIVGLLAFGFVELKMGDKALVPASLLRNREFTAAALTTLLNSAIFMAALMYIPQFMTKELRFSAMESGFGLLPLMLIFALTSFVAGGLYERMGAKLSVSMGGGCLALGMLLLSRLHDQTPYAGLLPGMIVLAVGIGLFYSSITTAAITAIDRSQGSLGGAIIYMCQVAGGAIGLGLSTAIVVSATSLPQGISRAFLLNAILSCIALVVSMLFVRGSTQSPQEDDFSS
jgi:predicted MFS family arabinose efflux permease